MGDLNLFQQICVQIFAVDLTGAITGSEDDVQKATNTTMNSAIDKWLGEYGWKITWGPRVWKSPASKDNLSYDNCWMISMAPGIVYPDGTYDTYVVAIAGTAAHSPTDSKLEDGGVNNVVDFDKLTAPWKEGKFIEPTKIPKSADDACFAAWGTAWGVYQLVINTSPDGNPGEKTTILEYLAGLHKNGKDYRVVFAGHSLGGALSPFLSLAVKANGLIPNLDPSNILTFPAAGATPGNGLFRDAYSKFFPVSGPGGYQQWNTNLYNTLDIVPHAWSTDDRNDRCLDKIVTIYGKISAWHPILRWVIEWAVGQAKKSAIVVGITYEPLEGNSFTGVPPSKPPGSWDAFIHEVAKQHIKAYHDEVGVGDILAQLYNIMTTADGVRKKTADEAASSFPVLRLATRPAKDDLSGKPVDYVGPPEDVQDDAKIIYPYDCIFGD